MRWVAELGGCKNHQVILMPAKDVADFEPIRENALTAFADVSVLPDAEGITGHPQGPNSMMRQAIWHCQMGNIGPWTFIEPDCIPRISTWADDWDREYRAYGKPFMGEKRTLTNPDGVHEYLTGNMALPKDALNLAPMLSRRGLSREGVELAFDIVAASQILQHAHLTKLLQQVPKNEDGSSISFPDHHSLKILRNGAVLFHPCKDGSLITRLREQRKIPQKQGELDSSEAHNLASVGSNPTPATPSDRELELQAEIARLRTLIKPARTRGVPMKPKRTPAEQAKINERMAKARAGRKAKK